MGPIKSIHANVELVADKVFDKPSLDTRETRHDDVFIGRPSILLDIYMLRGTYTVSVRK